MVVVLLTVSIVDSEWWPRTAAVAALLLAVRLVTRLMSRLQRRGRRRASQSGPAHWSGVAIGAVGVLVSSIGVVLDHPPEVSADETPDYAIIVPAANSPVDQCLTVRGTGAPDPDRQLWTVVQSVGSGLYYPGRPAVFDRTMDQSSWSAPVDVGVSNQPNDAYAIVAVLLTSAVSRIWLAALSTGTVGAYSELPKGSTEVARVLIVRKPVPLLKCPATP